MSAEKEELKYMERQPSYPQDYLEETFGSYITNERKQLIRILMGDVDHQRGLAIHYVEKRFGELVNISSELTKQIGTPKVYEMFEEIEHALPLLRMNSEFIAYKTIWHCAFEMVSARIGIVETRQPTLEQDQKLLLELLQKQE